jgi:hypothetical protein
MRSSRGLGPVRQFCLLLAVGLGFVGAAQRCFGQDAAVPKEAAQPAAGSEAGRAKPDAAEGHFLRLERDDQDNPVALQTAIVRFESDAPDRAGVAVDLIGAVHVGEKSYYEALNKAFEDYDAVLYELVAPPGTRVAKGPHKSSHPVNALQDGLKNMLGLEHQLEYIDYAKENMVHADMSPDEFSKSMADRGESVFSMLFRMMGEGISRQAKSQAKGKSADLDLLMALFDKNRAPRLKRVLAEQFEDLEGAMAGFNGPDGSTIITERNKKALQGLSQQLAAGKKRVAIFYGAGHLPDMAERLEKDFHLKRSNERWLTAWKLSDPAAANKR